MVLVSSVILRRSSVVAQRTAAKRLFHRPYFLVNLLENKTPVPTQQQQQQQQQKMSFHFGLPEYSATFRDVPTADTKMLKDSTLQYLKEFNPQSWYDDPIASIVNGEKLGGSNLVDTIDALGVVNGKQYFATAEQVEQLKQHICTYQSKSKDLRSQVRAIEQKLLTTHAGFLIGNQCLDFAKQDGVTEMEESTMANVVEQRLNDLLLRDEGKGILTVNRKPIYVSCVSNFTNFLDLFRKTLRSIEVGVPCVVLGRSNTVQHSYRWTELLVNLFKEHDIDPGMITYLSCSLEDIIHITQSCQDHTGNLYSTCSRQLAKDITKSYPNTITSTGGPNTLVTTELTQGVKDAIQMSASIESSGQCTALRQCVVPTSTPSDQLGEIFGTIKNVPNAPNALENGLFDGVFSNHVGSPGPSQDTNYAHVSDVDAYYRINEDGPPEVDLPEYWRKVVVDFTKMDFADKTKRQEQVAKLAKWLNQTQPISLAVNAPRDEAMGLIVELFDRTGMVVNTVGSTDDAETPPALTCQARPQEAEVFGEFPPRATLTEYTKYPVVVPSSTPSYDSHYNSDYLTSYPVDEFTSKSATALLEQINDDATRGYCRVLIKYLQSATQQNPKVGYGKSRTAMWGLQKPPLGTKSLIRCTSTTTFDAIAPSFMIYFCTTARDQMELSVDPENKDMVQLCETNKLNFVVESADDFAKKIQQMTEDATIFSVIQPTDEPMKEFPMAGQFVSLHVPLGHIKSTKPSDDEFKLRIESLSKKWLESLF